MTQSHRTVRQGLRCGILSCILLAFFCVHSSADLLYEDIMINDVQRGNAIADPDTSRNIAVDLQGYIHVAFYGTNGIRVATSTDRGATFNPSVLVSSVNAQCELAIDQYSRMYLVWVENNNIMFSTSTNRTTYSTPRKIGETASTVHMSVDAPYVYIMPRGGGPLLRNTSNGSGSFSSVNVDTNRMFADVFVNPHTHTVYAETDDPDIRYFVSTDNGASFGTETNIGETVYYPSVAGMFASGGSYMFVGGRSNYGYRVNLANGVSTDITLGNAIDHGRSLIADHTGNLVDGFLSSTGALFSISTNYGASFSAPTPVAGSVSAISLSINPLFGDVVAVYQDNGQIFCSVYADELICTNIDVRLEAEGAPAAVRPGDTVTYSLSITNMSSVSASKVVVSNYLPTSITYTGGDSACTNHGSGLITCWIGSLSPYSGYNVTLTGTVNGGASGMLSNRAIVASQGRDIYPANNTASTLIPVSPILEIISGVSTCCPASGIYTNTYGTAITNTAASPYVYLSTQYFCTGWTMTGNGPASGSTNTFSMTHTRDSVLTWIWGMTNVYLSRTAGAHGSISGTETGWKRLGTAASVTAIPDDHYHFTTWSGHVPSGHTTDNPLNMTMDMRRSITAGFSIDQHTLTVQTDQGTPTPSVGTHSYSYSSGIACDANSPRTLPEGTQYYCTGWTLSGNGPTSGMTNYVNLTLTNDATLHWHWNVTNVQLNASTDGHGSLSGDTTGWYTHNDSITITATPDVYEHFAGWSGDVPAGLTNSNPLSLTMDATRTIQANFTVEERTLNVTSTYGTPAPPLGDHVYYAKSSVSPSVSSSVSGGFWTQFVCTGWTMSDQAPLSGSSSSFSMTITNHANLIWNWQTNVYFRRAVNGPGTITGSSTAWYAQDTDVSITANPNNGYTHFIGWQGSIPSGLTNDNPLSLTLDMATAVTARFFRCESDLEVVSDKGTPSPNTGHHTYDCGGTVSPTANSPTTSGTTQFICSGWTMSGNAPVSGSSDSFSMTITNDAVLTWLWGQTNFYYSYTQTGSGIVTGSPTGWYETGTIITAKPIAATGGSFIGWQLDVPTVQTNNDPLFLTLDKARSIRAVFSRVFNELTVESAYGTPNPALGGHSNMYGSVVSASVNTPVSGGTDTRYTCTGWNLTGHTPASGSASSMSFTSTNDATLTWNWETNLSFTATAPSNGSISGNTSGWYEQGSELTVTANPTIGYMFCGWSGTLSAGLTNDNPLSLTLSTPHTISANFKLSKNTLTINSALGTADPVPGSYNHNYGTVLTNRMLTTNITASTTQLVCTGWTMTGNAPLSGSSLTAVMTHTNDATLAWNWATNVRLICSTFGSGSLSGDTGRWQRIDQNAPITANPGVGMEFAGWSGDVPTSQTNDNPLSLLMDQPRNITANFTEAHYVLEIVSAHGTGSPAVGSYTNIYGTTCSNTMPATISGGSGTQFVLTGWTLTGHATNSGTASPCRFVQTNDATLTWNWTTNVQFSWSVTGSGSVIGAQAWYPRGNSTTVTAAPAQLYEFDNWSGDVPSAQTNNQIITLTMDQARTVRANFSIILVIDFSIYSLSAQSSADRTTVIGKVRITNIGTDAGDAGKLSIWANRPTPANCGEYGDQDVMVGTINPGEIRTITFTNLHPGAGTGQRSLRAFIDSDCSTIEKEERNNQYACNYTYLGPVLEKFTFSAFAATNDVYLRWTAPTNCGLPNSNIRIVYNNSHYPDNAGDGTILFEGYTNMFKHTNCSALTSYFYTIWVNDGTYYVAPPAN